MINIFIYALLVCSVSFAESGRYFKLDFSPGLSNSVLDRASDELQTGGNYEYRLESILDVDFKASSLFYGGGVSHHDKGFRLFPEGTTGTMKRARLDLTSIYLRAGYDLPIKNFVIQPSIRLGQSFYSFQADGSEKSGWELLFGADILFVYTMYSPWILNYGIGYSAVGIKDKSIRGTNYKGSELRRTVHFVFGGGYEF